MADEAENKRVVREAFDRWAVGTGSVFDLLEADASWTIVGNSPVSRTFTSRAEFLDVVIRPFNARLAGPLVPVLNALYAEGDVVIAYFDGAAIALDGRPYANAYTWYLTLRDGRITTAIAFFDTVVFTDLWHRIAPVP